MSDSSLSRAVETVAEAWADSPYYADAEKWTFLFWSEGTAFRTFFDRLNLEATLELACGHGRHAAQIIDRVGRLVLMDVQAPNIEVCRQRLGARANVMCIVNNGFNFSPVEDASITAIYCYDAMVHFDPDVVAEYLKDTYRVLVGAGMALYHHSNYAAPRERHYGQNPHARNHMTKDLFADLARSAGLEIVDQRVIPWGFERELDCVSLVRRPNF